jgi:hypothetical protein
MASIRVRRGSISSVGVRIGQSTGTKLVNSSSFSIGNLSSINDIDSSSRSSTNSILMYNTSTQKYEHVSPFHVVDMSDSVQDSAMDAGTF